MHLHPDMTIGEIVAHHYRTAEVFSRHGIDFCCGGKRTLATACADKAVDWDTLSGELHAALEMPENPAGNADQWEPDFLVDYIVRVHHRYLRDNLPLLRDYTVKIARVHGARHPELKIVEKQVALLAEDLLEHLAKEENILFPYIKALCAAQTGRVTAPSPPFGSAQNPIHLMEQEHDYAGSLLDNLRLLTHGFEVPDDACTTYRVAFAKLRELDADLRWHVHLENNILFPKALLLEQLIQHLN